MRIREGSGEATVDMKPAVAFAYLTDPRNAPTWFAGVAFAQAPEGPPRAGMAWSFAQTQNGGRIVPARMLVYEPPSRFVWRTQHRWPRTNLVWELRCAPMDATGERTRLAFTIRIEPGPLGWLTLLAAAPFSRGAIARRAERAVERARAALMTHATGRERQSPGTPKRAQRSGKPHPRSGKR
jgi:uncharacterized protein YndB with AHSA1/START domain